MVIYSLVDILAEAQSLTRQKQVQISLVQEGVPKLGTSHVRLAGAQRMTRVQPVSGSRRKAGMSPATDQGAAGSEQSGCTGPVQDMLSAGPQHIKSIVSARWRPSWPGWTAPSG